MGHIKEGLPEDSHVIGGDGNALVIQASDADVSSGDLMYKVVGCSAFRIDSQTGALLTAEVKRIFLEENYVDYCVWPNWSVFWSNQRQDLLARWTPDRGSGFEPWPGH